MSSTDEGSLPIARNANVDRLGEKLRGLPQLPTAREQRNEMTRSEDLFHCPAPDVHGNPFRYCPNCSWVEEPSPQAMDQAEVDRIAALIYEHRWYGTPGQDRGRCNCHWDDPDSPGEITYVEHTRHVAEVIVYADTCTGEGER
jgi:hypothetical protein